MLPPQVPETCASTIPPCPHTIIFYLILIILSTILPQKAKFLHQNRLAKAKNVKNNKKKRQHKKKCAFKKISLSKSAIRTKNDGLFTQQAQQHVLERTMGVGPTSQAWEARILPMYYARKNTEFLPRLLIFLKKHKNLSFFSAFFAVFSQFLSFFLPYS